MLLLAWAAPATVGAAPDARVLRMLAWPGYADADVVKAFEQRSGLRVGFLVSLFSVGFLTDRYGARRTYLVTSYAAAASALLFAFAAEDFLSSLILYGLTGLCSGGSYTPGLAIISQQVARGQAGTGQGKAMGLYLAAASLGYALGLLAASVIIPLAGWRGAFVATALAALGLLLGWYTLRAVPGGTRCAPSPTSSMWAPPASASAAAWPT